MTDHPAPTPAPTPASIPDELLAAYALGDVSAADRDRIEAALAVSGPLRAKVARLRTTMALLNEGTFAVPGSAALQRVLRLVPPNAETSRSWLARAADVVASLVFDSRATPTMSGFRGSASDQRHMTFDSDAGEVDLQVMRQGSRFKILGQVSPATGPAGGRVGFVGSAESQEPVETAVDPKGWFNAEVPPGDWEIKIEFGDRIVVLPRLVLE